jgi:hypothetical protein
MFVLSGFWSCERPDVDPSSAAQHFPSPCRDEAHNVSRDALSLMREDIWEHIAEFVNLDTIEIDLSNAYCALGDCRVLSIDWQTLAGVQPKVVRILGLRHEQEAGDFMALRAQHRAVKVEDEDYQRILNPQKDEWEQWKMDDATEGVGT